MIGLLTEIEKELVAQRSGIAHNMDPRKFKTKDNSRGPVPMTEIESELVRSQVDRYFSDPHRFDTPEKGYEKMLRMEKDRIRLERDPSSYCFRDIHNDLIDPGFIFCGGLSSDLVKRWIIGGGVDTVRPSLKDAKAKDHQGIDSKKEVDPSTRSYTSRTEQESPAPYPDRVEVNGFNGVVLNKSSGPRTWGYTNRSEQDLSGVCVTSIDQVKTKANQIMKGDRSPEDTKSKDNLSVKRNNFAHIKVAQRSGIAHNKDPSNIETNDWTLVTRRSPKSAKLNDYLDVGCNNSNGSKTRSYTTRIEQEAFDRRSELDRVNVRDGAGSNKDNGPRSRSYIKRTGQRPPRVSVTEHPKNSRIEECAFVKDQSNKDAKSPAAYPNCVEVNGSNCNVHNKSSGPRTWDFTNRSEQDPSGVCATSIDHVKKKTNQIIDGDRSPEDAKLKDYLGVKTVDGDKYSGIAHSKDSHYIDTNDWTLVASRSPKNSKLNDYLDVGYNNRNGSKIRSYITRIEQEALDRRSEHDRVNVRDDAGPNNNGPRSRSYTIRPGQRPPRVSVTEHAKGSLNRTIEDIDIIKRILYFSGFNLSCKDFSPGSASLLSPIAAHLSCKEFSLGFFPLSSLTTGLQIYTNPTRLSPKLPTLLSNHQGSLNRSIDALDIPKWILYFSGFNLIGENFSPGSASLFASAAAHECYTNSSSGFNLSCKDFSSGFLSLSSPSTGSLNRSIEDIVILKWIMFFSGFKLNCKDFSPGPVSLLASIAAHLSYKDFSPGCLSLSSPTTGLQFYTNPTRLSPKLPTLLSNHQGSLNRSIDVLDILKWILYFSGFNLIGENFSPGSASLFASAAAHEGYTNSSSGFNLSCKDFSSGFLSLSSPTTSSSSYSTDHVDILKWILYSSSFKCSYKDFSPSTRPSTMIPTLSLNYQGVLNCAIEDTDIPKRILYPSDFNTSCKDFSPGFSGVNFNCKDFSPGSALLPSLLTSPTSDFNFSCKVFPLGFASLLSLIPANQLHTSLTWISVILLTLSSNYLAGFNFTCKDFFPDTISICSSTAPQQSQTNGRGFCCKDFSPGLSFSSSLVPPLLLTLYRDFILLGPETPQDLYYFEPYFGQA
jgi:hypothetical protein